MKDIIINKDHLFDFAKEDLKALNEYLLNSKDSLIDTSPIPISQTKTTKLVFCKCGKPLFESPLGQYRCGSCGNILYEKEIKKCQNQK